MNRGPAALGAVRLCPKQEYHGEQRRTGCSVPASHWRFKDGLFLRRSGVRCMENHGAGMLANNRSGDLRNAHHAVCTRSYGHDAVPEALRVVVNRTKVLSDDEVVQEAKEMTAKLMAVHKESVQLNKELFVDKRASKSVDGFFTMITPL